MFQEQLADLTADHLRSHAEEYLDDLQASFGGSDKINLIVPQISSISLVGGVIEAELEKLPLIGVDCLDKQIIPSNESLFYSQYDGAIVGMVSATDEQTADKRCKRYQRFVEHFINVHRYLHESVASNTKPFTIREFLYMSTRFSGSMQSDQEDEKVWLAGFVTNVQWITSEDGESQH